VHKLKTDFNKQQNILVYTSYTYTDILV